MPIVNSNEDSVIDRLILWVKVRAPMLKLMGSFLVVIAALWCNPFSLYWNVVFEGAHIHEIWPILVWAVMCLFTLIGVLRHRKNGLPQFMPYLAILSVLALLGICGILLSEWAIDWSLGWCYLFLFFSILACLILFVGFISYSETWRVFFNRFVVNKVRRSLIDGSFAEYIQRKKKSWFGKWGSYHCLKIVRDYYDRAKLKLLKEINSSNLFEYVGAGNVLVDYMSLDWPDNNPDESKLQIAEIRKEMITAYIWANHRLNTSLTNNEMTGWIQNFRDCLAAISPAYVDFMTSLFVLSQPQLANQLTSIQSQQNPRNIIVQTISNFQSLMNENTTRPELCKQFQESCANTWLALTPPELGPRFCADVWIRIRDLQHAGLFVKPITDTKSLDPAHFWAQERFTEIYGEWNMLTPKEWNEALGGRQVGASAITHINSQVVSNTVKTQVDVKEDVIIAQLDSNTCDIPSWPYVYVWCNRAQALVVGGALLVFGTLYLFLNAANPRMPFFRNWNTIDHVADIRFGRDCTKATHTAMATSPKWVALGTVDKGLILVNKNSRVPRENITDRSVLDVTHGLGPDKFLVLEDNQGIKQITAPKNSLSDTMIEHFVAAPANPVWPMSDPLEESQIIANELDTYGWLMAARGKGIARYRFSGEKLSKNLFSRERSWQLGPFSHFDLDKVSITKDAVWVVPSGGGIDCADRATLQSIKGRKVETPPIKWFETSYDENWAAAVDISDGLWLYPQKEEKWYGPFLKPSKSQTGTIKLKAASDITFACIDNDTAWLGTKLGLFAYNTMKRYISCALPEIDVLAIAPVDKPEKNNSLAEALVAGSTGLFKVSHSDEYGGYSSIQLDQRDILSFGTSPAGSFCVYRAMETSKSSNDVVDEICAIEAPFTKTQPTIIVPSGGWERSGVKQPVITGIEKIGQHMLFCTSEGAFLYNPEKRIYLDCSKALLPRKVEDKWRTETAVLSDFTFSTESEQYILAVAGGIPLMLQKSSVLSEEQPWRSLDPDRETKPHQLAECKQQIFGLGENGQIYLYQFNNWIQPVVQYCTGKAESLDTNIPVGNTAMGDILPGDNGHGSIVFINNDQLCTYDTSKGIMREQPLPLPSKNRSTLNQVRLTGDNKSLYLLTDGRFIIADQQLPIKEFSGSCLPFSPQQITAVSPTLAQENDVIISGPKGQILKYNWPIASWQAVGPGPVPIADPNEIITSMYPSREGIFVQSNKECIFFGSQNLWTELKGYTKIAVEPDGQNAWVLGENTLEKLSPESKKTVLDWEQHLYCKSAGMHEFQHQVVFAWQPSNSSKLILFTQGSEVGIYDIAEENFEVKYSRDLKSPSEFIANEDKVIFLDGYDIQSIDKDLNVERIFRLPTESREICIYLREFALKVAFIQNDAVVLESWENFQTQKEPQEYRRGGVPTPHNFNPRDVVYIKPHDSEFVLIDRRGAAVTYNPDTGQWFELRAPEPNQILYGWLPSDGPNKTRFLLETNHASTQVILLDNGRLKFEQELSVVPANIPAFYEQRAKQSRQLAKKSNNSKLLLKSATEDRKYARWYRDNITLPGDGILVKTSTMRVNRQQGQTKYFLHGNSTWGEPSSKSNGFIMDFAQDVAFTSSGRLWVLLKQNYLINLEPKIQTNSLYPTYSVKAIENDIVAIDTAPTGHLRIYHSNGQSEVTTESKTNDLVSTNTVFSRLLANINYAGYYLDWAIDVNGNTVISWRDKSLYANQIPIWGAQGKLAIQCVHDIAMFSENEFLLATEMGLVVRDAKTFVVKAIYPDIQNVSFLTMFGPKQILLKVNGKLAFKWSGNEPIPITSEDSETITKVTCGPWDWCYNYKAGLSSPFEIVRQGGTYHRKWSQITTGQWKFDDDFVNWIFRDANDNRLWLDTKDGFWQFDSIAGRSVKQEEQIPERENVLRSLDTKLSFSSPAITVSYAAGKLKFIPFDGPNEPVFEEGRFFFDNAEQMCVFQESLYTLIPHRCIQRRDPVNPAIITGNWQLPSEILSQASLLLKSTGDGLRLETNFQDKELLDKNNLAWEFDTSTIQPQWHSVVARPCELASGTFIRWHLRPGTMNFWQPFLDSNESVHNEQSLQGIIENNQKLVSLENWWRDNRFTWDKIEDVMALGEDKVVLICSLGPFVVKKTENGLFKTIGFWHIPGMDYCETARDRGHPLAAVVVGGEKSRQQYLISCSGNGTYVKLNTIANETPLQKSVLRLDYKEPDGVYNHRYIGLAEFWLPYNPVIEDPNIKVLESRLEQFPTEKLLHDGQFVCDYATSVCELQSDEGRWITFIDGGQIGLTTSRICINELRNEPNSKQTSLILVDTWIADKSICWVRPAERGRFYACYESVNDGHSEKWTFKKGKFDNTELKWENVSLSETGKAFQVGQKIVLQLPDVELGKSIQYIWDDNIPAFVTRFRQKDGKQSEPKYKLFVQYKGGIALAFDIMTSISVNQKQEELAIGTLGGIWINRSHVDNSRIFTDGPVSLMLESPHGYIQEVNRVRYEKNGELFAKYNSEGIWHVGKLSAGSFYDCDSSDWPGMQAMIENRKVFITSAGLNIGNILFERSNDAWGIHRRPLTGVVDSAVEEKQDVFWFCTRDDGLFKVMPQRNIRTY